MVWVFSTRRPPGRERLPDRRCSPTQPPDLPDFRCWLTGPLRHVRSSPPLGLLRVLRPIPRPWVGNGPAHLRAGCPGGRATGGWFPRSPLDHSFREVPSYIPVASPRLRRRLSPWPPARPLQPGPELTIQLHEEGGWLRATDRPLSTRFEPVRALRDFHHWFTCVTPSDLARRTRIVWSCRHVPPLSGLLPTLSGVPGNGLPPGSANRCDGSPVESFHLHMVKWRLVAHVVLEVLV